MVPFRAGSRWQPQLESRAPRAAHQRQASVVRADHGLHDRQAEAGAAGRPRARAVSSGESLPDAVLQVGGNARPVVGHAEFRRAVLVRARREHPHGDGRSRRRVRSRVGEQVGQHLMQPVLVAGGVST
jgi:hypothetical protein